MSACALPSTPAEIIPVRGDVFDFSSIPAFGPLPLLDESVPAAAAPSRSRRRTFFVALAVGALSAGYGTWSAATWTHRRGGSGDDSRSSQAAAEPGDPISTGSIPLTLRPTIR